MGPEHCQVMNSKPSDPPTEKAQRPNVFIYPDITVQYILFYKL